jgi:hypothetical protein
MDPSPTVGVIPRERFAPNGASFSRLELAISGDVQSGPIASPRAIPLTLRVRMRIEALPRPPQKAATVGVDRWPSAKSDACLTGSFWICGRASVRNSLVIFSAFSNGMVP